MIEAPVQKMGKDFSSFGDEKAPDAAPGSQPTGLTHSPEEEDTTEPLDSVYHPGVRYRVDWVTDADEVVYQKEVSSHHFDVNSILEHSSSHSRIFEVVTTYEVSKGLRKNRYNEGDVSMQDLALRTKARPRVSIHIFSKAIINALRSVVDYYPGHNLYQEPLVVSEPYAILVHHRERLEEFGEECRQKKEEELCVREIDAYEHLKLLQRFLDLTIMPSVHAELERNKRGFLTWDMMWLNHKPGDFEDINYFGNLEEHLGAVNSSAENGTFNDQGWPWKFNRWVLDYDGETITRRLKIATRERFDGECELGSLPATDLGRGIYFDANGEAERELVERGKHYFDLLKTTTCQYYKGKTASFPSREVEGLVMVDMKTYYSLPEVGYPRFMNTTKDLEMWVSDCVCSVCNSRRINGEKPQERSEFAKFHDIAPEDLDELDDEMYYLLPANIHAYVFKTRTWEELKVDGFSEPVFDQTMIDKLVMDETRLIMMKSLAASYIRQNKFGQISKQPAWQADFVEGKGKGQIFLLHGKPGVGKTYTAECIASYTKRPLMVLNTSDIGSNPRTVEDILTASFKRAKKWNAVLLIDEADVFMERRSTNDLERNSLVAGFLRALEYYDGILFLTTNRVGHFDDAFTSRIHHKFRYPDFSGDDRRKIWKSFMEKLAKEREGYIRLAIDAKEYLASSKEMEQVKWNGREIRNGFQTAVALAEYDGEKDAEGTILVREKHFSSVVKMTLDFQEYLDEVHSANEDTRAAKARDR